MKEMIIAAWTAFRRQRQYNRRMFTKRQVANRMKGVHLVDIYRGTDSYV